MLDAVSMEPKIQGYIRATLHRIVSRVDATVLLIAFFWPQTPSIKFETRRLGLLQQHYVHGTGPAIAMAAPALASVTVISGQHRPSLPYRYSS